MPEAESANVIVGHIYKNLWLTLMVYIQFNGALLISIVISPFNDGLNGNGRLVFLIKKFALRLL